MLMVLLLHLLLLHMLLQLTPTTPLPPKPPHLGQGPPQQAATVHPVAATTAALTAAAGPAVPVPALRPPPPGSRNAGRHETCRRWLLSRLRPPARRPRHG